MSSRILLPTEIVTMDRKPYQVVGQWCLKIPDIPIMNKTFVFMVMFDYRNNTYRQSMYIKHNQMNLVDVRKELFIVIYLIFQYIHFVNKIYIDPLPQ